MEWERFRHDHRVGVLLISKIVSINVGKPSPFSWMGKLEFSGHSGIAVRLSSMNKGAV